MQSQRHIYILYIRPNHIPQVRAVYHLPQVSSVRYAGDLSAREMLPYKSSQQKEVMTHNKVGVEIFNSAADRAHERVLKLRYHVRCQIAVPGRLVRHYVRHADDRERKCLDRPVLCLARRREIRRLVPGLTEKDRIARDTVRKVHTVRREYAAYYGLSVSHAVKGSYQLCQICAAPRGMRLLRCNTQDLHASMIPYGPRSSHNLYLQNRS